MFTRREWMQSIAGVVFASAWARADETGTTCTLSIGTYSLKGLSLEKSIATVAEIGYDAIEIATQPGFDGEPAKMPARRRGEVRSLLNEHGLQLTALMEHLPPAEEDEQHRRDLDRLRRVFELARDLSEAKPPLMQTVLGGGVWEQRKNLYRDRLGDWLELANEYRIVLAIKPHRGGALSRPAEALWLIEQLGKPDRLRMVYDYSHYAFRDLPVEETVRTALPITAHIAVKDAVQKDGRVVFQLPGQSGEFDYARLLRLFYDGGYRGDVCCEVSSMVSNRPGYDPLAAAKICYENVSRAFTKARVPRP